jgi:hypothetical protein
MEAGVLFGYPCENGESGLCLSANIEVLALQVLLQGFRRYLGGSAGSERDEA